MANANGNTPNLETLRARVAALGFELIDNDNEGEDRMYFVLDPKARRLTNEPDGGTTLEGIADWCVDRETDIADADAPSKMCKDDFNSPPLGREYERFLKLLASAGGRDRFKALDIRRQMGVEAAARFLGECNVTREADHGDG